MLTRKLPISLRAQVCHALGLLGDPEAGLRALLAGTKDGSPVVRAAAAAALGSFAEERRAAATALHLAEKDPSRTVKIHALQALTRIADELPPEGPVSRIARALFAEWAVQPARDRYLAQHAALALGILGDRTSNDTFLDMLSPQKRLRMPEEVHAAMATALALAGDERAAPHLREILAHSGAGPQYRGYCALALGLLGDTESLPLLRRILAREKTPADLLRSGCWALGLLGDAEDAPFLLECLGRQERGFHEVRGAAAIALSLLGEGALDQLLLLARSGDVTSDRAFAIAALGMLADPAPVPRHLTLFRGWPYRSRNLFHPAPDLLGSL
jgi:HEAT repeat protein